MSSTRLLSLSVFLSALFAVVAAQSGTQNENITLYTYSDAACTTVKYPLQFFPPWQSGVSKCTAFGNGDYQDELAVFNPSTCQASLSYTVYTKAAGFSGCGVATFNATGATETFLVNVTNPSTSCNAAQVTPAVASGYVLTNLLPYFTNVPASCPAPVGPPLTQEVAAFIYNSSTCAFGTGYFSSFYPPWTPGVQKCTTWYGANGTQAVTLHQSELVVYNSSAAGCGATLYWSVWNGASYSTCGSAMSSVGATESGVLAVSTLGATAQCSFVSGTPVNEVGYMDLNLDSYITGYSPATACAAAVSNTSTSSSSSSSTAGASTGGSQSTGGAASSVVGGSSSSSGGSSGNISPAPPGPANAASSTASSISTGGFLGLLATVVAVVCSN